MKILVACEFSGRVRRAFAAKGHDVWSCDLLPSEDDSAQHVVGDVLPLLGDGWDLLIAHPPCTHLAVSGARWWPSKRTEQAEAIEFFMAFVRAPAPRIAVENPVGLMSRVYRQPTQIIHPWQHGHGETKATCLWLKGLPPLEPSNVVEGREPVIHRMGQSKTRWMDRSRTYEGIAQAMADQWGTSEMRSFTEQLSFGEAV